MHIIGQDRDEGSVTVSEDDDEACSEEIYINPLDWFESNLSEMSGKLNCPNPKCAAKVGSFDWCGSKCACGAWIAPAFHMIKSKVDLFRHK
jgi:dual specificity phosphatase 12